MSEAASTKADDVALELEQAIVSGSSPPGTVLRQDRLVGADGVSPRRSGRRSAALAASASSRSSPTGRSGAHAGRASELREAFLIRAELESLATRSRRNASSAGRPRRAGGRSRTASPASPRSYARGGRLATELPGSRPRHRVGSRQPRVPRRDLPGRCAADGRTDRERGSLLGLRRLGPLATRASWTSSTARTSGSTGRSSDALAAGSPSGARALAREHVLSSGALLERILAATDVDPTRPKGRFTSGLYGHLGSENHNFGSERSKNERKQRQRHPARTGQAVDTLDLEWATRPVGRDRARLHGGGRHPAARLAADRAHARPPRRREALAAAGGGGVRRRARRPDRRPGSPDGEGRAEGDLSLRLAGRGGRKPRGRRLSGPEPLSREQRARRWCAG